MVYSRSKRQIEYLEFMMFCFPFSSFSFSAQVLPNPDILNFRYVHLWYAIHSPRTEPYV
jgi:hypothetical protein